MLRYDPRSIASKVYANLKALHDRTAESDRKEQKSQAVELYSYIAAWGLLRLKAEELALAKQNQQNKQLIVACFFQTLGQLVDPQQPDRLAGRAGLDLLSDTNSTSTQQYLGWTGIALQVAREFSFWAEAIYPKDTSKGTSASRQASEV